MIRTAIREVQHYADCTGFDIAESTEFASATVWRVRLCFGCGGVALEPAAKVTPTASGTEHM